jgi:hypothetical protein
MIRVQRFREGQIVGGVLLDLVHRIYFSKDEGDGEINDCCSNDTAPILRVGGAESNGLDKII